jgi:succinyl-diaminopimelate desuccinylase
LRIIGKSHMSVEEQVTGFIEGNAGAIAAMLGDLIAIPTVNPPGRAYRECTSYLSDRLHAWGIEHRVIEVPSGRHPRFSLVGSCGPGDRGLHFHGHYDVVAGQSAGQFRAVEREGRIYGRGSSDMKGGIAAMLFALYALAECRAPLSGSIGLSLVPDEETGGALGMRHLSAEGLLPDARLGMLMPEPSSGVVWHASRGALSLRVRIQGKPAHVGLTHQGVNAFEQMADLVHSLVRLKQRVEQRRTALPVRPPEANRSVMLIGGESGGRANFNVVPDLAWFSVDRRLNPEEHLDEAKRELDRVFDRHRKRGAAIEVEVLQEGDPSISRQDAPLARVLRRTIADVTGRRPRFELCPGILEIRFFSSRGVPGYCYGPGLLEVSHGPDEYVRRADLIDCAKIYALTALRLLAGTSHQAA